MPVRRIALSEIFDSCIKFTRVEKRVQERDTMCEGGPPSGLRLPLAISTRPPFRPRFFCERPYEQRTYVTIGVTSHDDEKFKSAQRGCFRWVASRNGLADRQPQASRAFRTHVDFTWKVTRRRRARTCRHKPSSSSIDKARTENPRTSATKPNDLRPRTDRSIDRSAIDSSRTQDSRTTPVPHPRTPQRSHPATR